VSGQRATGPVVLRVTDEFGAIRPFANDAIKLDLEGPAEIIGDNPFALIGGTGAIWIRAKEQPGTVVLTATCPRLGTQLLRFEISLAPRKSRSHRGRDRGNERARDELKALAGGCYATAKTSANRYNTLCAPVAQLDRASAFEQGDAN
jgi:hypothetical protein